MTQLIQIQGDHPLAGPPANGFFSIPVRTPQSDGLTMPAEWEAHDACWMVWPCSEACFKGVLPEAKQTYAKVARAIADFEPVYMLVNPEQRGEARNLLGDAVTLVNATCFDSWARDSAPTFVRDGKGNLAGIDWVFTGWGHYPITGPCDEGMAIDVLRRLSMRRYTAPFILEGGSIHVDGKGTLITTEQCLLDPKRNAGFTKADFQTLFKTYLGIDKILWIANGLEGDETTGHVDILATFARPGLILLDNCTDPHDPNFAVTQDAKKRLAGAVDTAGNAIEIMEIPQPAPQRWNGKRMDISYINFYMPNGAIIMSAFNDPADDQARQMMQAIFPDRTIVQIPSLPLFAGGGGIHCITQQQPAGAALPPF
nr:agmatine deiminase family protein [uncultured Desulfobacter sp.]